jgi:hypothetical protein
MMGDFMIDPSFESFGMQGRGTSQGAGPERPASRLTSS